MLYYYWKTTVVLKDGSEITGIFRTNTSSLDKIVDEFWGEEDELRSIYSTPERFEVIVFRMKDVSYVSFSYYDGGAEEE